MSIRVSKKWIEEKNNPKSRRTLCAGSGTQATTPCSYRFLIFLSPTTWICTHFAARAMNKPCVLFQKCQVDIYTHIYSTSTFSLSKSSAAFRAEEREIPLRVDCFQGFYVCLGISTRHIPNEPATIVLKFSCKATLGNAEVQASNPLSASSRHGG